MFRSFIQSRMVLACAAAIMVLAFPAGMQAAYTLDIKNSNPLEFGNYGNVDFAESGDSITITFTAVGGKIGEIAFNTSGLTATQVNALTFVNPAGWEEKVDFDPDQGNSMDGFGKFDVSVRSKGNQDGDRLVVVAVTISLTGVDLHESNFVGTAFNGSPGQSPALFAAHYFPSGTSGDTFYVGTLGPNPVPAPPSIILAASGAVLFGLGGLVRRFRRPGSLVIAA